MDISFLYDLHWRSRAAKALQVANSLDVFAHLSQGAMSVEQLAEQTETKPEMLDKLLIVCAALGLLEKDGEAYRNSEFSQKYLVKGSELYQGDIVGHFNSLDSVWADLGDRMLAEGAVKKERDGNRDFIMGMHNIAVCGRTELFLDNIDLSGRKKLFDVGGGPGSYTIAACKRYPELQAIIFDLPETIVITKEMIAKEGMGERISVREGSWDKDDFGEGNDVVLLSEVMHGAVGNAEMKLAKAYESLVEGGLVVVQEFLLNDDKSGPLIPAVFNLMVGAYSKAELFGFVEGAGFKEVKLAAEAQEHGSTWITGVK
ncbi:MAG: hypothetical protein FVQ80_10315 [Planctomycetes bacterium]|nr:hypothetical protein [Planctomycetota bacterium]